MKLYWRMGWRNIFRNKRRSAITLSALAFSVMLLVFFIALMESYTVEMEENVIGLTLGHLQVHHPHYRSDQNIYQLVEGAGDLVERLSAAGYPASARRYGYGLAASDETGKAAGIRLQGIDLDDEARVTGLHEAKTLAAGRYLTAATRSYVPEDTLAESGKTATFDDPLADPLADPLGDEEDEDFAAEPLVVGEIVLGKKLATTLGVAPGDVLSVVTMAADGTMGNELFDVVGVLKNFSEVEDRSLGLVTSESFQRLFHLPPDAVHEIAVRSENGLELAAAQAEVEAIVGDAGLVESWRQIVPAQAQMIDLTRHMTPILALMIYLGAALLIMNAMLMMVFERIHELGVMKALGVTGWQLLALIYFETFWMCVIAALAGLAAGLPLSLWIGRHGIDLTAFAPDGFAVSGNVIEPVLYAIVTPDAVWVPVISLFLIAFASVLYPALKAAVIEPVKAIYHV